MNSRFLVFHSPAPLTEFLAQAHLQASYLFSRLVLLLGRGVSSSLSVKNGLHTFFYTCVGYRFFTHSIFTFQSINADNPPIVGAVVTCIGNRGCQSVTDQSQWQICGIELNLVDDLRRLSLELTMPSCIDFDSLSKALIIDMFAPFNQAYRCCISGILVLTFSHQRMHSRFSGWLRWRNNDKG